MLHGHGMNPHLFYVAEGVDLTLTHSVYIDGPLMNAWRTHEQKCRETEARLYVERELTHDLVVKKYELDPEVVLSYYDEPFHPKR